MPRLFTALDVPEDKYSDLTALGEDLSGARWASPEQSHLTLRFLGDVERTRLRPLVDRLAEVESPPFTIQAEGLTVFPSRRNPRVLVVALEKTEPLIWLQQQIESIVQRFGLEPETRPFHPHVTLARFRGADPEEVHACLRRHSEVDFSFEAEAFYLYESILKPEGPEHIVRARFPLDGDGDALRREE